MRKLSVEEEQAVVGGEAITLAAVLALMAIGVITVVCYRIFFSSEGKVTLPGGYSFTWK